MAKKSIKKSLSCKDFEKMINNYINGSLDDDDTIVFLNHISLCSSCKEELTIQFMVSEGLNKLEENGTFDLNRELEDRINYSYKRIQMRNLTIILASLGFLLAVAAIAFVVLFLML